MSRIFPSALGIFLFFALSPAGRAQNPPSNAPQAKAPPDASAKKNADAGDELQKAVDGAGNDRAALVRNLKSYLQHFPDAPQKAEVYRALVEACAQLRDNECALDNAERLIAIQPDNSEMMMTAVDLLQQQGEDAGLTRAASYVRRVLDRIEKSSLEDKPARVSAAEWQDHRSRLRSALYFLRGQIENSQRNYSGAVKDLEASFSLHPNASAAELLGEIAEARKDYAKAIEEYSLAFTLPEGGASGKVDRREVRRKLGNVWRQVHGSDQGLGEAILAAYDRSLAPSSDNASPAARNKGAKEPFAFVLRNIDGKDLPMAPLKGKVVVLSFWATWCGPCREVEPIFGLLEKSYSENPHVAFLAVNTDEDQAQVPSFLAREKWGVTAAFADGLDDFLGVNTLPTLLVLDRDGKIVYRVGGIDSDEFPRELIAAIQGALERTN